MDKKQLQKILAGIGLTTLLTGAGLAGAAQSAQPEGSDTPKMEKSKPGSNNSGGAASEMESGGTPCGGSSCSGGQEEMVFGPDQENPAPAKTKGTNSK